MPLKLLLIAYRGIRALWAPADGGGLGSRRVRSHLLHVVRRILLLHRGNLRFRWDGDGHRGDSRGSNRRGQNHPPQRLAFNY